MSNFILIDEITDGQILGEAVINNFGQTLIPAGVTLKKNHISLLKTWSIETVSVKSIDDDDEEEISEDVLELAKKALTDRIFWEPRNENEEDIIELAILATAKLISRY